MFFFKPTEFDSLAERVPYGWVLAFEPKDEIEDHELLAGYLPPSLQKLWALAEQLSASAEDPLGLSRDPRQAEWAHLLRRIVWAMFRDQNDLWHEKDLRLVVGWAVVKPKPRIV